MYCCVSGTVHTGVNFIEKSESCAMVRYVRVTYVRHGGTSSSDNDFISRSSTSQPTGFSYKTFVPAPVTVSMCSGTPNYENFSSTWDRAKTWLKLVGLFINPCNRLSRGRNPWRVSGEKVATPTLRGGGRRCIPTPRV